ncbi:MAG: hypothetical protein CSA04_04870, partial [Bacteroidetes bacterium]
MKTKIFPPVFFLLLFPVLLIAQSGDSAVVERYYPKIALREDLNTFVGSFRSVHPKPYWYTSAEEFDTTFRVFAANLPDSATVMEFYSLLLPFVNFIGDENTRVLFPRSLLADYRAKGGTFFPMKVRIVENEVFVKENLLPDDTTVRPGVKIAAINGVGIKRLLKKFNEMVPATKASLRMAEIAENFSLLLWSAYQFEGPYDVSVTLPREGMVDTYRVDGVPAEKLGISSHPGEKIHTNDLEYAVDLQRNFATVTIRDYVSHRDLKAFLAKAFGHIQSTGVPHVVIDVRDLDVQDEGLPDAVLQYVTRKPYRHYAAIEAKSSPLTKKFYRKTYRAEMRAEKRVVRDKRAVRKAYKMVRKGLDYANTYYAPELKRPFGRGTKLDGEFYLLVNEGSRNSATVLAAIVQDHKLGLVIGNETGSRASRFKKSYPFTLPHTGLECRLPHRYYLRPSSFDSGFGVLPDYVIDQGGEKQVDREYPLTFAAELFKRREV